MKNFFVILVLVLFAGSSFAQELTPVFNAANVKSAKSKADVKLSKEADEMLSTMVKFAPTTKYKIPASAKKGLYDMTYVQIGKFEVYPSVDSGRIRSSSIYLNGIRLEDQLVPVLKEMFGNPSISKNDATRNLIAVRPHTTSTSNDSDYVQYHWEYKGLSVYVRSSDDLIFEYDDGRKIVERPKRTELSIYKN